MKPTDYAVLLAAGLMNFWAFRWASVGPYITGLMLGYVILARPEFDAVKAQAERALGIATDAAGEVEKRKTQ